MTLNIKHRLRLRAQILPSVRKVNKKSLTMSHSTHDRS